jgi:hypothetical protein
MGMSFPAAYSSNSSPAATRAGVVRDDREAGFCSDFGMRATAGANASPAASHADCALLSFYSAAKGDMAFGH